ncbi:MAG: 50S ribosomal protein L24 [Bacteroidota bacterium]|jgi:large subunit ribosomal protein L24
MQTKLHIKKGDTVKVIAGDSIGQEGKVLEIDRASLRAIVEGVNMVSKHAKPSASQPQGGIIKKEASIHISNLMLSIGGKTTKVGRKRNDDGKIVRYAKKTGEVIK